MKKTLIILCLIFITGCSVSKEVSVFKELGYNDEQVTVINTLNKNDQDLLSTLDYNENYIELIKSHDFKEDNFNNYIEALNKLNVENTLFVVNNNYYNSDINYDDNTLNLMHGTYYINDNLDRYLSYQENHNLEVDEIITRINSNLDYEYYTNTVTTDLSKKYLILVNKYNYLKSDYVPDNLVKIDSNYGINSGYLESTTYENFKKMTDDAKVDNVNLYAYSPYRSYNTQVGLYNRYVERDGKKEADTYSAIAGFSEHQTGLAVDISKVGGNISGFENTNEFKWLQNNAYKYGFILRYPEGKEYITGYQYESWHYRYVSVEVSTKIKDLGITFEEYYAYYVK